MTDDQNQTTAVPPVDPQAPGTNPLDALEKILQDAQANAGGADNQASVPDPAAEEQARIQAEAEQQQKIAQSQAADQQQLQEELAKMREITKSPEYQARIDQQQTAQTAEEQQKLEQAGLAIHQLEHRKQE